MADGKQSFLAYADWKELFDSLPDDKAGKLIKHIFAYVNDENPKSDDFLINTIFIPIKSTLKRDLKKWEDRKESKSTAGRLGNLKRYNIDLYEKVTANLISLEEAENLAQSRRTSQSDILRSQNLAKLAVNDSVSVSVSVSDNVSVFNNDKCDSGEETSPTKSKNKKSIEDRKADFKLLIEKYKEQYSPDMLNDFWRYWTEMNDNGNQMRFEKQKTFGVGNRLATWKKNESKFNNGKTDKRGHRHEPSKDITSYGKL